MMGQIFSGAVRAVFRKRKGFGFVKILHWLLLALFSAAAAFARLRLLAAGFDANGLPVPMNLNTMALPAVLIVAAVIVLVMARRYPAQRELCGGMDLYFAFDRSTLAVMLTVLGCFALIGSAVYSMVFSLRTTVTMALSVFLAVGAAKMTVNTLGAVSSVTGSVLSGTGDTVGNGVAALSEDAKELFGEIDFNATLKEGNIPQNIRTALLKSDVKELQPDYLQKQLAEVKDDLEASVKKIVRSPQQADESIDSFLDRLKQRTENISKNIDRNDLAKAIANNTNMSKAEANKTIDQYMNLLENARMEAGKQIDKLEVTLKKAAQEWKEIKHEALVAADKATDAAARSALISFLAILSGAVLCCIAGAYGSRKTQERVDI